MAFGKNSRIDNKRSSSSCSAVIVVALVALCLAGVWMMTSTSVLPAHVSNSDMKEEVTIHDSREEVTVNDKRFEDGSGDVTDDVDKELTTESDSTSPKESGDDTTGVKNMPETVIEKKEQEAQGRNPDRVSEGGDDGWEDPSKVGGEVSPAGEGDDKISELSEAANNKQQKIEDEKKLVNEKIIKENVSTEAFPDPTPSELLNETNTQNGEWSTQATESKKEKEAQLSSNSEIAVYNWKLCNVGVGPDYIPCLDNTKAISMLRSTKHYEHRERHCPEEGPSCLVSLPEGYKRPVKWPKSRDKIWYANVPHAKLAEVKGHQNWVKVSGEYLTFPGGGTQFKRGAQHYIDFIKESVPEIAWGERIRVVLDVGCGVASFGGFLFDRDVLTMSFAPKDEHEAQVQFALERGIPAISAVMGTKRLPFPGNVFDVVHCARCRVPWHIDDGMLLLELNRLLRPGGYFVWSATPVYKDLPEDVKIWKAMSHLTRSICWEMVSMTKDSVNEVGMAIYKKPLTNECYDKRVENDPPLCKSSDDPNAAWNVPLQACMHSVPVDPTTRGSRWPEQWPERLDAPPYWLNNSQIGVYGRVAPEDFKADNERWKRAVNKSYLNGTGINWSIVRNVMDMRAVYGGFAAAMRDMKVWVMNVVSIDSADTLPVIYERGLFGIYHDWCQSFSSYPRTYDLMHADHLFSRIRKRCKLLAVMAEVDRLLRPEGNLIVRDNLETIEVVKNIAKSLRMEVRMSYSKENQGLLCVQKTTWRPKEFDASM